MSLRFWRSSWVAPVSVRLTPLLQLLAHAVSSEATEYAAEGDDPQFRVDPDYGIHALVPGWYVMHVLLQVTGGGIQRPCLYPDYGGGCSEATRIPLPQPDALGRIKALVLISRPLRALRFDPTIRPARFRAGEMKFRRIARPHALWMLLQGVDPSSEGQAHSTKALLARCVAFFRSVGRQGLSSAVDELVHNYYGASRHASGGYLQWLDHFDPLKGGGLELARVNAGQLESGPLISVVLPVYNTPLTFLRRCIDSVRGQTYENWELCIADDASSDARVAECLAAFVREDARIKVVAREQNGHISEATNSALALASGSHVAFLDHDDELSADALHQVVVALKEHPQARLLYSDEDKIDASGRRFEPHFKPGWNPELLRSQNYICHLMVVETSLLAQVGLLRAGFEGSQDHDLVLRCTEVLLPEQICHIPRVLYHWRAIEGSTALGGDQKSYASEAGRRAVSEHLQRIRRDGVVETLNPGCYRTLLALPTTPPRVSVIIPTKDRADLLSLCVRSVLDKTDYPDFEVIVVDNGSLDPDARQLLKELHKAPNVRVLDYPIPFNFSAIVNHGVRHAEGSVLCLLNNDTEVINRSWLHELVARAAQRDAGAIGAMLYYPDDTIQHAGVVLGLGGVAGHVYTRMGRGAPGYMARAWVAQNMSAVTAACMVVRREIFEEVGGFDEALPVAFNDIDFCLRLLQAGYRNVWTPYAELYHHESASRGSEDSPEKQARFAAEVHAMKWRWGDLLHDDVAYNPNLTLDQGDYGLAFPPRSPKLRIASVPIRH
ncbi:glycosyltransferase [Pseudoxanthomonas mexicana]|uniref:glycosyltransferase family 2 protein n=1 Tax=Pseudoxanthomonas mexicana TaxID=128785 RepID=UPI0009F82038|nr:glycosyltransferase family 2 protein [Pseudoxanthomonas mexicana]